MSKQLVIVSNVFGHAWVNQVSDAVSIVDESSVSASSLVGLPLAVNAATPAEEVSFWGNFLLFVVFFVVLFLWARGGIQWWERSVDPLIPSSFAIVSDIMQLGIGGLAFMSLLTVAFNICDLWTLITKHRSH